VPAFAGSEVARTRSRVAVTARLGTPADIEAARQDHAAAKLADYVAKVVAEAPPLSPAQRDRIAILLRGGASI